MEDFLIDETELDGKSTTSGAAQDRERMRREVLAEWEAEEQLIRNSINPQSPQASSLDAKLNFTEQTATGNDASRNSAPALTVVPPRLAKGPPTARHTLGDGYSLDLFSYDQIPTQRVSYVRGRYQTTDSDHGPAAHVDSNADAQASDALGLEQPASCTTRTRHSITQPHLRGLLPTLEAAVETEIAQESEQVSPTDNYLSTIEDRNLRESERGLIYQTSRIELRRESPFQINPQQLSPTRPDRPRNNWDFRGEDPGLYYASGRDGLQSVNDPMRRFQPNVPPPPPRTFEAVVAEALKDQQRAAASGSRQGRTTAATKPDHTRSPRAGDSRAMQIPPTTLSSSRVTRGKRKREEEEAAAEKHQREA